MKDWWSIKTLKEVCLDFIVPQRDKPTSFDGDIPWCRIEDIEGRYLNGSKSGKMVTHELAEKMNMHLCPKGTVISACSASIGNQAITTVDCYTNQTFIGLVADPKILNNIYLYYFLESQKSALCELGMGATIKYISQDKYKRMQIPIPSLSEQQRIVDILDEAFEKIDVLKANAEQNLQDAKALFQAALREELEPKDGWVRKPFTDICEITSSLVDPRLDEYRSLLHIGGANIESETGVLFDLKTAEEEGLTSGKFTFDSSMVLYNKIRPYLKKVARPNFSGLCSADMYPLSPLKGTSRDFLYYLLLSDDFTKYAVEGSPRTGMPKVNRACLFAYKCYVPSENEQRSIASRLDNLNDRCKALQTNYDKTLTLCDDLKQALLRKAFNGEL